jgi:alpha-L-fucosidase
MATRFEPTLESVRQHVAPQWFHDAKFGIFIHWGPYSVPAWAPRSGQLQEVARRGELAKYNPYAEWYQNTLSIEGSPTSEFHSKTYGEGFSYYDFVPIFKEASQGWNAEEWASLFELAGARYVVLTTKHHDGFLLWPSAHRNPFRDGHQSERDLVALLTSAVRAHKMRMGFYYSGGIDWTFHGLPIVTADDMAEATPQGENYVRYADAHWRELIDQYQPSILWNDIGYPEASDLPALLAHYYNHVTDGVVNDRFRMRGRRDDPIHYDFRTPEYRVLEDITEEKWETCRGIGNSFSFNRDETPDELLSSDELVHMLADIVSKNGNLLLNVGPAADGTIPSLQAERLVSVGWWLRANGDAIYGTRPWHTATAKTADCIDVRFTQKEDAVYAILLGTPQTDRVLIQDLELEAGSKVELLGSGASFSWEQRPQGAAINLPWPLGGGPAHSFRISPTPSLLSANQGRTS